MMLRSGQILMFSSELKNANIFICAKNENVAVVMLS